MKAIVVLSIVERERPTIWPTVAATAATTAATAATAAAAGTTATAAGTV